MLSILVKVSRLPMAKKKTAPTDVKCEACNGIGFSPVIQPARPGRKNLPNIVQGLHHQLQHQPRRTMRDAVVVRWIKPKRYDQGALMRKLLEIKQKYLELRRLRIEVGKAEMELKKRQKADQRRDGRKR